MKKLELSRAVPPMPESFVSKMNETLKEIEYMKKRRKFTIALAAALVAVLALASVAVAQVIDSGILGRLFGGSEPGQQAVSLLQTDVNTYTQDGITLNIDELLFDGRSVNCEWTVTSDRENAVFVLTGYELTNVTDDLIESENSRGAESSHGVGDNTLAMLGGPSGLEAATEYVQVNFTEPLTQEASLVLTLNLYETQLSPTPLDGIYPDEAACAAMEAAGQIGVHEGYAWLTNYPAFQQALDNALSRPDDSQPMSTHAWEQANLAAHTESGLMNSVGTMTVTIPLEIRENSTTVFGPETFELNNCTLEIDQVSFSAAATSMEMRIYPKTRAEESEFFTTYRFVIGANGQPWLMNQAGSLETDAEGRQVYNVSLSGAPVTEIPAEIVFVRVDERIADEAPMAQYTRLLADMPEGETAVMKLN